MKAAVDAATKESAWFVVASKRTIPPGLGSSEGDASPWYGILLADIGGKCRSVAMFGNGQPDQLPADAQRDLAEEPTMGQTAKALDLEVPPPLLARADEVIE